MRHKFLSPPHFLFLFLFILSACGDGTRVSSQLDWLVDSNQINGPVIELRGGREINHEVNTPFAEPGFSAASLRDGDITNRVERSSSVDSTQLGRFSIRYSVQDSLGQEAVAIRRVTVRDTIAPVIVLNGSNPHVMERGTVYTDAGVIVSDNFDLNLAAVATSNVDPNRVSIDGVRVYRVDYVATDSSGNGSQASRGVQVIDTQKPFVSFDPMTTLPSGRGFFDRQAAISFSFVCESHIDTSGVIFTDASGGVLGPPAGGACENSEGSLTLNLSSGLGVQEFRARQTDIAGNTSDLSDSNTRSYRVGPDPLILSPAAQTVTSSILQISGSCTQGASSVEILGDVQSPGSAECFGDQFLATIQLSGAEGLKNVEIKQTDAGGITRSNFRQFIKDPTGPNVAIMQPLAGAGIFSNSSFSVTGACESGLGVGLVQLRGDIQTPADVACVNNLFSFSNVQLTTGLGAKNIRVLQKDAVQNETLVERSVFSRPLLAITAPAANTLTTGLLSLEGDCASGAGVSSVEVLGGVVGSPTATCSSSNRFNVNIQLTPNSGNAAESRSVTIHQTDAVSVLRQSSRSFLVDATAPTLTIASPLEGAAFVEAFNLSGSCESGLIYHIEGDVESNDGSPLSLMCAAGSYSRSLQLTGASGSKTVSIRQADAAGNQSLSSRSLYKGMALSFTSPVVGFVTGYQVAVTGTCTIRPGVATQVSFSGNVSGSPAASCNSGTGDPTVGAFSANLNLQGGCAANCSRSIHARQIDAGGVHFVQSSLNVQLDEHAPVVSITSPSSGLSVNSTAITVSGSCDVGPAGYASGLVRIAGTGVSATDDATCNGGTYSQSITLTSGDGVKVITAQQTDFAGNTNNPAAQVSINLDTLPPSLSFSAPAAGLRTNAQNMSVTGTCIPAEGAPSDNRVYLRVGNGTETSVLCSSSTFSFANIPLGSGDGVRTLRLRRVDAAGNEAIVLRDIIVDRTAPVIAFSPEPGSGVHSLDLCAGGLDLTASASDADPNVTLTVTSGSIPFRDRGDYLRSYRAEDSAGNQSNRSVTVRIQRVETLAGLSAPVDFDFGIESASRFTSLVSQNLDKNFILCSDLDFNDLSYSSLGINSSGFSGILYGSWNSAASRPFQISNVFVNSSGSSRDVEGLLDRIESGGRVQNLILTNIQFHAQARNTVGALAGLNLGVIRSVSILNSRIEGDEEVGGITGMNAGSIERSMVGQGTRVGRLSDSIRVGGLTGVNWGFITNSYVESGVEVMGQFAIGGLVGEVPDISSGQISHTYSLSQVSGVSALQNIRGLVGQNERYDGEGVISSYYNEELSIPGDDVFAYGSGAALEDFYIESTFLGWDFTNIWLAPSSVTAPILRP
jgi:hypothetical protein